MYEGAISYSGKVRRYFSDVILGVVSRSEWVDLRKVWSSNGVRSSVRAGTVVVLSAAFRFVSNNTVLGCGQGQLRDGYYRKRKIVVKFKFDAWETTSTSSKGNLSGIWRSTMVGVVRSVAKECDELVINITCLGVGTGFDNECGADSIGPWNRLYDEEDEDEV
jgi:hypothetical protein